MTAEVTTETRKPPITDRAKTRAPLPYQPNTDPFHYLSQHFAKRTPEYHRSKLYNTNSARKPKYRKSSSTKDATNNALIAAAGPLFALLNRLDPTEQNTPYTTQLNAHHWQHEMHAFIDQATHAGYNQKTIAAASFALSKLVDDTLSQTHHSTTPSKALMPAHLMATQQKEAIFNDLLHACQQDPEDHLDLTELLFLCLANIDTQPADTVDQEHVQHPEQQALVRRDTMEKSLQLYTTMKQHRRIGTLTASASDTTSLKHARHQRRKRWLTASFILLTLIGEFALYQHNRSQFLHRQQLQHQANQKMLSLL